MHSSTFQPSHSSLSPFRWRRWLAIISWLYLAGLAAAWLLLLKADEWWPATILLFSPRWVLALPLAILLPIAFYVRWKWSVAVLLAALIIAGPVTGFNLPWQRLAGSTPPGKQFKVMTLNMHYLHADPGALDDLIAAEQPDVVAIQEWPGWVRTNLKSNPEWHVHGTPRLFLASRHPIRNAVVLGHDSMGEHASAARYELDTPLGVVHVFSLHTATERDGIADTIHRNQQGPREVQANSVRRREQSEFVANQAKELLGPILIVGDFNTPPESTIFTQAWSGYTDAFDAAGWGWGYTFYGAKTRVRIDHVLAGAEWRVTDCRVGPYVSSPHRPVIADLVWSGP
jgi:vancomycin resistance protein VanJ